MKKYDGLFFLSVLLVFFNTFSFAQPTLVLNQFASGLIKPNGIANAGDTRLFVTGKDGFIWVLDSIGNAKPRPFLNIDSEVGSVGSEQGLLGLAFSPNYKTDGYFFVNYTDTTGDTHIARFSVSPGNPDSADASSEKLILFVKQPFANHNGGCLIFGPDNLLYCSLGDGGSVGDPLNNAQNKKVLLGKILRIDPLNGNPYLIPSTNPFATDTAYAPEIWAMGLRNPWRFSFDRHTADLWIGDVGQHSYEEIDFQQAASKGGENYGWRCYEGDSTYFTSGCAPSTNYIFPVHSYDHAKGCAITGGYVYRGANEGDLYGRYLSTDYCGGVFLSTTPDGKGGWKVDTLQTFSFFEYTAFGENTSGELFVTAMVSGKIMKITTAACAPTAHILSTDSVKYCGPFLLLQAVQGKGFSYQWNLNGGAISGATTSSYQVTQSGDFSVLVTNDSTCSSNSNIVHVDFCNSTDERLQQSISKIYPNPAINQVSIEFYSAKKELQKLTILNALGQEIYKEEKIISVGVNNWTIDTEKFAKGFYLVNLEQTSGVAVRRLVVN